LPITRDDAEAQMFLAQARKFDEEAKVAIEDAKIKAAEARKKVADAEYAEHSTESMRIQREQIVLADRIGKASNYHHRVHEFIGDVEWKPVEAALTDLAIWDRVDPECDITIIMDSPGGVLVDGMHLFDEIAGYSLRGGGKHKITMKVRGEACSMAGILLQSADERIVGHNSTLMIHKLAGWASGRIDRIQDSMVHMELLTDQVVDIFMDRVEGKLSREEFTKRWDRRDWFLGPKEAVALGLADRIG
jgi:ATP-dependent protease ClpP protease subunit